MEQAPARCAIHLARSEPVSQKALYLSSFVLNSQISKILTIFHNYSD